MNHVQGDVQFRAHVVKCVAMVEGFGAIVVDVVDDQQIFICLLTQHEIPHFIVITVFVFWVLFCFLYYVQHFVWLFLKCSTNKIELTCVTDIL